jgi:hypothetical protein
MILSVCWLLEFYTNKFILTISQGTIVIIGFNLLFISILKEVIFFVIPTLELSSTVGLCIALSILIIFYPIILFLQKKFPAILGK